MNIVLFEADEIGKRLSLEDERMRHVFDVLRRKAGDDFDAGVVNGRRGKARVANVVDDYVELEFELTIEEPPLPPIDLIAGLSRPQTNRRILQDATTLGVRSLTFVMTERGEPSYASSKLWTTGEWRRHLIAGAAQAFTTHIPIVDFGESLETTLAKLDPDCERVALDNYEGASHLADWKCRRKTVVAAFGAERGWTGREREQLRSAGFELAHLGERPLRTETAVVAGLAFLNQRLASLL